MRHNANDGHGQAVVIGSGMAGLSAAKMLSKHFSRVVVLEKDEPRASWQASAAEVVKDKTSRPGITQYNQVHALLAKGLQTLDDVFDGRYTEGLSAAGGNVVDMLTQFVYFHPASGLTPWARSPSSSPLPTALASRHLLETTARKLLQENERVIIMYNAAVTGLIFDNSAAVESSHGNLSSRGVTGVQLADGRSVPCELLVECSGRGSALPNWLAAAGYERPRVSRASANCGYSGWYLKLDPRVDALLTAANCQAVSLLPDPPSIGTFGLLMRVEDGMWVVSIGGYEGVHPPKDDAQLLEWGKQHIWHPIISQLLQGSTQLAPATRICGLASTWRRYDELTDLPEGLVILADSLCSFNPAYGQGMTIAAMEVAVLDKLLTQHAATRVSAAAAAANTRGSDATRAGNSSTSCQCEAVTSDEPGWLRGLGKETLKAVQPIVSGAWLLAVGNDMRFPSAVSNQARTRGLMGRAEAAAQVYMHTLLKMAPTDNWAKEVVMRVINLLDETYMLLQPRMLYKVAKYVAVRQLWGSKDSSSRKPDAAATSNEDYDSRFTNLQRCFGGENGHTGNSS